jgi:GTPase SAR1 family protein
VRETYCKGARGAIIVFDLTRVETFLELHEWLQTLWKISGKVPLVICANKTDLKSLRKISRERALDIVRFSGAKYFETSAKTGENVAKAFLFLAETILKDSEGD